MAAILLAVVFMVIFIGCTSPETSRSRGTGLGADVGNRRGAAVSMHEGSDPYAKTPKLIRAESPSLAGARQAERLSR